LTAKESFIRTADEEHARTMKLLRAYPSDKLDLKPHALSKTARELGWVFALERYLGTRIWNDEMTKVAQGKPPAAPENWNELVGGVDKARQDFMKIVRAASDADLQTKVHFFVGPKQMGELSRMDVLWFLLHDQIHHRGQFSIYLRMAGGKVPSIYGPTADEPWI